MVRSLRLILTLLLALAWGPLAAHCRIESLTGLKMLRCSNVEEGAPVGDSHCEGDTCCSWESGQYRLPQGQMPVLVPLLAVVPAVAQVIEDAAAAETKEVSANESPPGASKPWQFALRAALLVRAPSIAS
jgi:hypothetical protein